MDEMTRYYAERAAEYDRVYSHPAWAGDLPRLGDRIEALFPGRRVFEVACGTGYWTQRVARVAARVHAEDLSAETLALARRRAYAPATVTLARHDAYVPVNNGSGERALGAVGIAEKFFASAELTVPHAKAVRIREAILALEEISVAELAAALRAD